MIISENPHPASDEEDEFFDGADWLHFASLPWGLRDGDDQEDRDVGQTLRDLEVAGHSLARVFLLNGIIKETVEKAGGALASFRLAQNDEE